MDQLSTVGIGETKDTAIQPKGVEEPKPKAVKAKPVKKVKKKKK